MNIIDVYILCRTIESGEVKSKSKLREVPHLELELTGYRDEKMRILSQRLSIRRKGS